METKKSPKANLESKKTLLREIGFIIALFLCLVAFEWNSYEKTISLLDNDFNRGITDDDIIPITRQDLPSPPEFPKVPVVSDVIQIVDVDVPVDDIIPSTEDIKNIGVEVMNYVPKRTEEASKDEVLPFVLVEEKPAFMGGDENEFTKWVAKNMVYPEIAKENRIQGRVIMSFIVTAEGKVTDVQVLRGVDPSLDKEATRVIAMSPKWTPGKQRNKAVRVKYTFPVIFRLR